MFRCLALSSSLHVILVVALVIMSWIAPPLDREPPVQVRLVEPQPRQPEEAEPQPTPRTTPAPTPRPQLTPEPERKIVKAEVTPIPEPTMKEAPTKKKVIKNKEIVEEEVTPTPTPTPTPKPTPKPKATPFKTPKPTPTPPPRVTPRPEIDSRLLKNPEREKPVKVESVQLEEGGLSDMRALYRQQVVQKINRHFKKPINREGITARVQFVIERDGTINPNSIRVLKSTGNSVWDQEAIRALRTAARVPPLDDTYKENFVVVVLNFQYWDEG